MTRHADAASILTGQTSRMASVTPSRAVAIMAKVVVAMIFILIVAGALVTGNKAALSNPTWPAFSGRPLPTKETWVGGLRYEDSHRIIAAATGLATLALALIASFRERRKTIVVLCWVAVGAVMIQALLGAGIILSIRNVLFSIVHACVAQAYLCIAVAIAVMTATRWRQEGTALSREGNASFLRELKIAVGIVYFQLMIGAGLRHSEGGFLPHLAFHIITALAIIFAVVWLGLRVYRDYRDFSLLRRGMNLLFGLLGLQIALGIASIFANRSRLEPEVPHPHHIATSTLHVLNGAVILAVLFAVTLHAHRRLWVSSPQPIEEEPA